MKIRILFNVYMQAPRITLLNLPVFKQGLKDSVKAPHWDFSVFARTNSGREIKVELTIYEVGSRR